MRVPCDFIGDRPTWGKVLRNAPYPCGSGGKYVHRHGWV